MFFWFFYSLTRCWCATEHAKKSPLYSLSEGQCLYFIFLEVLCSLTGGWNATDRANYFPLYIALHDGQCLPIIYVSQKFYRTFMLSKNISWKISRTCKLDWVPMLAQPTLAFMKEANVCVLNFFLKKLWFFFQCVHSPDANVRGQRWPLWRRPTFVFCKNYERILWKK